jgi:hypothetical protein
MDILNWLYLKTAGLVKTTANNANTDLIALGANVGFNNRGDQYQTYGMTLSDAVQSGNVGNTKHYELDMAITSTVTVDTPRGIIDVLNTGTLLSPPDPAYATSVGFYINNIDLDLTAGNRDNIYVQYSVYYNQAIDDNVIPHLIATGATPLGLGFTLYNANPAVADTANWTGALYVYYELYTIN